MDKPKFYNDLLEEEARLLKEIYKLNELLEPIRLLKQRYGEANGLVMPKKYIDTNIEFEQSENTKRNYKSRISNVSSRVLEALTLIDKGTANEVGEQLHFIYPNEFTLLEAKTAAKTALSKMNKINQIHGYKVEGKNSFMYSIIHEDEETGPVQSAEDVFDIWVDLHEQQTAPDDDLPF